MCLQHDSIALREFICDTCHHWRCQLWGTEARAPPRPLSTINFWYFTLELCKLSHQFLMSNVFRILRTTGVKIKLIIFFIFIEKHDKGVSFLKHSVICIFFSFYVCHSKKFHVVCAPPRGAPNPGDATACHSDTCLRCFSSPNQAIRQVEVRSLPFDRHEIIMRCDLFLSCSSSDNNFPLLKLFVNN